MNEPTQHAQSVIGNVTTAKALLDVVKGCRSAGLHGRAAHDRASYSDSFVFEVSADFETRKKGVLVSKSRKEVQVPGWVSNGHTDEQETRTYEGRTYQKYTGVCRPLSGFWWLYATVDRLVDVLELLPNDAEVSFHVYLDAGTTEGLTAAKLHADHLYLNATYTSRGKRVTRQFLIDAATGGHNSARFGQ